MLCDDTPEKFFSKEKKNEMEKNEWNLSALNFSKYIIRVRKVLLEASPSDTVKWYTQDKLFFGGCLPLC